MAMQQALASLLMKPPNGGGPPGPPPPGAMGPPPATLGLGAPPDMPGLPPAPEGIGAMPTGSTANNAKQAADVAISALRDAKGYFPSMGDSLDGIISQLQSAAQAPTPPTPVGAPGGPGAALPTVSPTDDSGSKGAI